MEDIIIINNKENNEFKIGHRAYSFDEIADYDLFSASQIYSLDTEDEITKILQKYGAITYYDDVLNCEEVTEKDYEKQLENYNLEKYYILAYSYFTNIKDAEKCLEYLIKLKQHN